MSDGEKDALTIVFSMGNFSKEEIKEISAAFSDIAPIQQRFYIRMSAEVLPAVLIFSLGFVLGGIAEGFFRAVGADIYQKAKKKVVDSLKGKEKPTLRFEMFYKDVKISVSATTNDEDTLNKVFDTINKAKDLAVSELDKKETPEMTEIALGFDKDWKLVEGMNWKPMDKPRVVKFYKYNEETGKWELTRDWSDR
jgi:hypothetical protein